MGDFANGALNFLADRSMTRIGGWLGIGILVGALGVVPEARAVGGNDASSATQVPMVTQKCQAAIGKGVEKYAAKASMAIRGCLDAVLKCDEASDAAKALTCRRALLKASGKCSAVRLDEDLSMIGAGAALTASGAPTSRAALRKEMNTLSTALQTRCITPGAELGDPDTGLGFSPEPTGAYELVDAVNPDPGGLQCLANALVRKAYPLADEIVDVVEPLHETCIAGPTLGAACSADIDCGAGGACGKLARVFREGSIKACAGAAAGPAVCGNGTAEAPEQCDDGNLDDLDGCSATCTLEPAHQVVATGQTSCWNSAGSPISCTGTEHDGEVQAGRPALAYVDNGDGTITDVNTGLMWEKLSDDGSIHDKDNGYTWANAFAVKIATLNAGGGFAGYTDWRVPNIKELISIVNYQNTNPSVSPAFDTGCVASCTVTTCSCTVSDSYWSSSTLADFPFLAWFVDFYHGSMLSVAKPSGWLVRAVRGGL
jgi:cysteine-rich repeat protein